MVPLPNCLPFFISEFWRNFVGATFPPSRETNRMLDDLADASNFPSSSDDLISTTYSPQVSEQVYELQEFQRRLLVLQSWIEPFTPEGSTEEKLQISGCPRILWSQYWTAEMMYCVYQLDWRKRTWPSTRIEGIKETRLFNPTYVFWEDSMVHSYRWEPSHISPSSFKLSTQSFDCTCCWYSRLCTLRFSRSHSSLHLAARKLG